MEHTKAYQEFKKNGNTKFVRYSEGAEMYHMSVSKFMQITPWKGGELWWEQLKKEISIRNAGLYLQKKSLKEN